MEGRNKRSCLRAIFRTFFMERNTLQTNQQLLLQILQCLAYIIIINGVHNRQIAIAFKSGPNLLLLMILLVFVRYFLRISLGVGVYLVALQLIVKYNTSYTYVNVIFIAFLIIAQTISSISFDVSFQNAKSESRNINKIFHNILLPVNVVLIGTISTSTYLHICFFILFSVLFVLKSNSLIKNEAYRSMMLRFYLWASLEHLRLFLNNFISTNSLLIFFAFAFGSQLLFFIYSCFSSGSNLYEFQAKEEYLKLGFYVLRNSFTDVFNERVQTFVKSLADQEELDQLHPGQNTTNIILGQLNKTNGFLESLLKIQIHIINGHILVAKEILTILQKKVSWFSFIDLILLHRMQQQILSRYEVYKSHVTVAFEEEYQHYLAFQELLHKEAIQHLKYNLYFKKSEIELASIKEMCTKIILYNQQIHRKYHKIKDHFTVSTYLFVEYLLKINNDLSTAGQVLNQHKLQEKCVADFDLDEKIYIRLKLQQSGLDIDKIGYNCKELLDYNRKDLQGQKIERIVPPFFRKQHETLCSTYIHQQFQKMFLFQKNIVVLNNKNSYSQCSIMTKLNYRLHEDFYFEGHLHIIENTQYDLSSYFFVNDKGNILEFGQSVIEEGQRESNSLNISQIFNCSKVGLPLTRMTKRGLEIFQPILFNSNKDFYFYSQKIRASNIQPQIQINGESKQLNLNQQTKDMEDPNNSDGIQQKIKNKQVIIMLLLTFIFIGLLFGSEYLMIYSAQVKYNNQKFVVGSCRVLMSYYNNSLTLQFNNVYTELRDYYNYSNTFFSTQPIAVTLRMQSINEFLKPYYISAYKLPTFTSKISYMQNNFELIENLVVNSYIYQVFKKDTFMRKIALDNNKLLIPVVAQSTTDYRITLFNIMNNFVQKDLYYEQLALGVGLANIFVFIIFALRLFCRLRNVEETVLELRCNGGYNRIKTNQILQFLYIISHEEIQTDKIGQEIHIYDTVIKTETDSMFLKSEMSLIKEPTGRSLMNDSLNKTGFVQELNRDQNKLKVEGSSNYYFRKGKSHRYILIAFGSVLLILLSLHVSNEILNYRLNDINEVMSINSVISLYRTSGFFGSRAAISTLNTILLKLSTGMDYSKSYNATIQAFYLYMKTVALPIFPQTSIQQFSAFAAKLNNLYQSTICSYMPCIPMYYDQVDLNFVSVINKISANLTRLANQTMNMTPAQFTAFLAIPSNKLYIDLIFYSESIMRNYITDMIMLYLDNYFQFIEDLYLSKLIYIGVMIGLTILGLILFLALVKHIRDENTLFFKVLKIYK